MDDRCEGWPCYPSSAALNIVLELLGSSCKGSSQGRTRHHDVSFIHYLREFDLKAVEQELRRRLDEIGWLYLSPSVVKPEQIEWAFSIAPIQPKKLKFGYHATRVCLIEQIREEGLKPSNEERRATNFPDTEGVVHVCAKLREDGGKDSAEWWREELSKKNRFGDPNWGILGIDLSGLPAEARSYQDMHSASGIVVDRIGKIPGKLISEVA